MSQYKRKKYLEKQAGKSRAGGKEALKKTRVINGL
jgi:hypothetical protein